MTLQVCVVDAQVLARLLFANPRVLGHLFPNEDGGEAAQQRLLDCWIGIAGTRFCPYPPSLSLRSLMGLKDPVAALCPQNYLISTILAAANLWFLL